MELQTKIVFAGQTSGAKISITCHLGEVERLIELFNELGYQVATIEAEF